MGEEIFIRHATKNDIPLLVEISQQSVAPAWSESNFLEAVDSSLCKVLVGERSGLACGYLVCYHAADEGEIPSVAVSASSRRQGVAVSMMKELFLCLQKDGIRKIFLEVREHNEAAVGLYERMGFLSVGVRKNFYDNPKEDAIIMMRDLNA